VTDDAAVADHGGETGTGMDDGAVLNGRARAHRDGPVVPTEDRSGPDARLGADKDIADHDGVGMHKSIVVNARCDALNLVDRHGRRPYTWPAIQVTPW
jgi:hypothetical protein